MNALSALSRSACLCLLSSLPQLAAQAPAAPAAPSDVRVALPQPIAIPGINPRASVHVAVVGAHLSGMPLNGQLRDRGATLLREARTAPDYRLFALPGSVPPKPGLLRVAAGSGHAITVEVWEMPMAHYGSFVAMIPAPLGIGTLVLEDGSRVQGFLCEPQDLADAPDVSRFGGWRAYLAAQTASADRPHSQEVAP